MSEYITEQEKWFLYRGKVLPRIYREYLDYLRTVKGLSRGTIHNRKKPVLVFDEVSQVLDTIGDRRA